MPWDLWSRRAPGSRRGRADPSPVWPIFELANHIIDPRLMTHIHVHRRGVAQIMIEWVHPRYAGPDVQFNDDANDWLSAFYDPNRIPECWQLGQTVAGATIIYQD